MVYSRASKSLRGGDSDEAISKRDCHALRPENRAVPQTVLVQGGAGLWARNDTLL